MNIEFFPYFDFICLPILLLFVRCMCLQKKKVVVFYGSQTGTAEGFAGRLAKDARSFGLPSMVFDPEDCDDWVSVFVYMCVSTKSL